MMMKGPSVNQINSTVYCTDYIVLYNTYTVKSALGVQMYIIW